MRFKVSDTARQGIKGDLKMYGKKHERKAHGRMARKHVRSWLRSLRP